MKKVERIVSILFLGVFGPRQGVHFNFQVLEIVIDRMLESIFGGFNS